MAAAMCFATFMCMFSIIALSAANDDKPQLYNFTDAETGHVLALVKSQLTFTVNYPLENGTMDSLTFSLSAITPKVKGFLGASRDTKTALMWILWPVANESSNDTAMLADVDADFEQYSAKNVVNLTLAFKSRKDKSVWLESAMLKVPILNNDILKFNMKAKHFGDITSFFFDTALNIQENETPIRFECSTQKYPGTSETATSTATLVMADTSMQAFLPDKQKDFSKDVSVCPLDAKVAVGVGQWQLNETDKMCLLLKGSLTMLLKYQKQGEGHTGLATVPVPSDAKIDSSKSYCGNSSTGDDAVLALTFFNHLWSLRLTFENNNTAGQQFELKTIHIDGSVKNDTIAARYFPDFKDQDIHHKSNANDTYEAFSAKTDTYLMCNAEQTLNVGKAQIVAKSLTMEAFVEPAGKKLTASLCAQDVRTSDLVPIIVGSCLALLVIVVLIAYLIGRHRAKRTGYASV